MYYSLSLRSRMSAGVRKVLFFASACTFLLLTSGPLSAEYNKVLTNPDFQALLPDAILAKQTVLQNRYLTHRFVALPAANLFSPDPDQLRIQDLRGIECYAQPDALQVCGAGDTIPIMFFTKSVSPLQDIRLDVVFEDGIEYGGFAYVDNSLSNSGAQLDTISTENPEAPTFLIDMVSEATGGVVLYLGVRAECGTDFSLSSPDVTLNFSYTNADGVACTGSVTLEDYGQNVIVPRVVISSDPANTNLGRFNTNACQSIDLSQTTLNTSATGYIFSAEGYGFEEGISISMVNIDGTLADPALYTIDPVTGRLELTVNKPTADGLLGFNETTTVQVCYTYSACFPNVDYPVDYGVVSACDGVFCTGPENIRSGELISDFPQRPQFTAVLENEMQPDLCAGIDYSFELLISTVGSNVLDDQVNELSFNLRRCKIPGLNLSSIEVLTPDGMTVLGALDGSLFSVRGEDEVDRNGNPSPNRAGTVQVDIRKNAVDFPGSNLEDLNGNGNFADLAGGNEIRLRLNFPVSCSNGEGGLSCNAAPNVGGTGPPDCQFNQINLSGRQACNAGGVSTNIVLSNATEFIANSAASFVNEDAAELERGIIGYEFGVIGATNAADPTFRQEGRRNLEFEYTLDGSDFFSCDGALEASLIIQVVGADVLTSDLVFENAMFGGVASGAPVVDNSQSGFVTATFPGGSVTPGTAHTFSFDVAADTATCLPPQLLFVDAFLITPCPPGCDCSPVRACSSTVLRIDSDSINCVCTYSQFVEVERVSTGYTDDTRTTDVAINDVEELDKKRFISGDTIEIRHKVVLDANRLPDFNEANRSLYLQSNVRMGGSNNLNDRSPALLDYQLQQLMSFSVIRPSTGQTFDIGSAYSGLDHGSANSNSITVGTAATLSSEAQDFNTVPQPGFPNGGYNFGFGNFGEDGADGQFTGVEISNFTTDRPDGIAVFFDAIGGSLVLGDTIEIVTRVPLVDNPAWNGVDNLVTIEGKLSASAYIGDIAAGNGVSVSTGECSNNVAMFQYESPSVVGESRIEYTADCEAEMVVSFSATGIPADWYINEYRLVAGLEQFSVEIPFPYAYSGGATVETASLPAFAVEPDSTSSMDTAQIVGVNTYLPTGTLGKLYFIDAEFRDGVRDAGYKGFYTEAGQDDITTIGGTYPLLGFQGGMEDSVVFRIPLTRTCGAEPFPDLEMDFDAANKHLPDLDYATHLRNSGFYDGKVMGNEGQTVTPRVVSASRTYILPFRRLEGTIGSTTEPISRERQVNNAAVPIVPVEISGELAANTAVANDFLTDGPGSETNNFMLCPRAGAELDAGAVSIELASSVDLISVNAGGTAFTLALVTDTSKFYAVEIPMGLGIDNCFSLDIETDLLFCDAGFVCLNAVLGCPESVVPTIVQVATSAEFMLNCGELRQCYEYRGGTTEVTTGFDLPMQSGLCSSQTYGIVFTNSGSGPLFDIAPVIQIPTGLDVDAGSFQITLVGSGAAPLTAPLTAPVMNADSSTVYGNGFVFNQAEINAFLGPDGFEPGDVITISFDAATSCDFVDGSSLAARLNVANACLEEQQAVDVPSDPIRVVQPAGPAPAFELDVPDMIQVSCGDNGTELLITTLNVGKAASTQLEVMFTVPSGFSIDTENLEVVSPSDFTIDDITETVVGGGVTMYSFTGPPSIEIGGALCVKLSLNVDGVTCGVYAISTGFKQMTAPFTCPSTGETCTLASILTESSLIDVEVVPSVAITDNSVVSAECGTAPNTFDIAYSLEIKAPSADFSGVASLELYKDANANGTYEAGIDLQLGSTMVENIVVDSGAVASLTGSFDGINASDVCPVLIRFIVPGCECGESVLPLNDIEPTFLENLGESLALCPGEEGMITGVCVDLNYSFAPASAGTVTDNGDGTVTYSLNPGVTDAVLNVGGAFGTCGVDVEIPVISPANFEFGPYTATVCNEGGQQIDFNIPATLQEDLEIRITPATGLDDPTSFEPVISNLLADQSYTVEFTLNGSCMATTTLDVTVDEAPMVTLTGATACSSGFDLSTSLTLTPSDLTGEFQTMGDGAFTTGARSPGVTEYIPGPMDIEAGQVSFRFVTDSPAGPCGPDVARMDFTILIVDCGNFFWQGSND